jgi:hypothetical protein
MKVVPAWFVLALLAAGPAPSAGPAAGPAAKTYLEYRAALSRAGRVEELLPYLSKARRAKVEETPVGVRARMFALLRAMSETVELEVVKETATPAGAALEVRVVTGEGSDEKGAVTMTMEEGSFRVDKEDFEPVETVAATAPPCEKVALDLKSASAVTRARAAGAVGDPSSLLHTECLASVPALADALGDPVRGIRDNAARTLRSLLSGLARRGPGAVDPYRPVLPKLVAAKDAAAKESETVLEINLQAAIAAFGGESIPSLVKDLKHPERELRWGAAQALERLGPAAAAALADVKAALAAEQDELTRDALAAAEKAIRPQ